MEDYELDINTDPNQIAKKLPQNIGSQKSVQLQDFHEIDLRQLIPYQNKSQGDFSPWNEADFNDLVESIQKHGVLEPITARPYVKNGIECFEILAGEHRWKASCQLELPTIPVRIRHNCSDEEAIAIFTLTNIMKRETTLRDRAFGCWLYTTKTKFKTEEQLRELVNDKVLVKSDLSDPLSRRQLYRYSRIHELPEELFNLVNSGVIDLNTGARMATLSQDQKDDLYHYCVHIKSNAQANKLVDLAAGKIPEMTWDDESIEFILRLKTPKELEKKDSIAYASKKAKLVIKELLPTNLYPQSEEIFREALSLYLEKNNIEKKDSQEK